MDELAELARRSKTQAPPPWVVSEALRYARRHDSGEWFDTRPGEIIPSVLQYQRPSLVVWSSIWPDQPQLQIRFDIEASGAGSLVTWTLLGREGLSDAHVQHLRHRLNELINGQLRESFDQ
ncbi:MAG: hypothetical protein M3083_05205 [Actinomycetota bacterium]|nr:hypothetical protein [Actinomycetota bacterium]